MLLSCEICYGFGSERVSVLLGYTTSDYDLYGGSRNMIVEGQKIELPRKKQAGTFFIGLTYDF